MTIRGTPAFRSLHDKGLVKVEFRYSSNQDHLKHFIVHQLLHKFALGKKYYQDLIDVQRLNGLMETILEFESEN